MLCPCGSSKTYKDCCSSFHIGEAFATTPEQLMRSRYCAYAMKNGQYIYDTYASKSQKKQSVDDIQASADESKWMSLTIISTSSIPLTIEEATLPTVTFCAKYLVGTTLFSMTEISSFTLEQGHWKYVDGDNFEHVELGKVKRNELCPCQSNKKFKACCGK